MNTQDTFANALLDPDAAVPPGLIDPQGRAAGKRFNVYRNTVASSLSDALEAAFPAIQSLVGDEYFRAMAGVFVRAHPPGDPRLQLWGGAFPGFLARFEPVRHLPYLPDIARLELGLRQSYHAADTASLNLTGIAPKEVLMLSPRLAPSTLVLSSRHPILDIWRFARGFDSTNPKALAQDLLIARPGFDPTPHLLPEGGLTFLRALKGRLTLAEALTHAQTVHPAADPAAILTRVLSAGALTLETGVAHARPD